MSRKQPNLVFIFADQLNYQSCGFSGESRARTPTLDHMAANGVSFDQAVSCSPLCSPYRASLLTGKFPSGTGQFRNDIRVRPDSDAIGHALGRAGYQTGYIGKWHLYCRNGDEQFTPPGPYRLGFDNYFASYNWNHDYWNGFYYLDDDKRIAMKGYQTDAQTDLAIDFILQQNDEPFGLYVSYEVPHPPCAASDVPSAYFEAFRDVDFSDLLHNEQSVFEQFSPSFDRDWQRKHVIDLHQERCRAYYAMVACLDHNISRLFNTLEQQGILDDTIVVFTSDHGDMLGGNGRIEKRIFFEQSVRVPFLIQWNNSLPRGERLQGAFNTPDIAATLADLMDIPSPGSWQGRSWAPRLRGETVAEPEFAFITLMQDGFFNHHEEYRAVRGGDYLYAKMVRSGKEFLFNYVDDPREIHNLAYKETHSPVLKKMRHVLSAHMKDQGDVSEPAEYYESQWIEDGCIKAR